MQKKIKEYYTKPTDKKWRKIGDALLACAALIGGGGLIAFDELRLIFTDLELKIIIGIVLLTGIVGKFLTNFFGEKKQHDV